MHWLLHRIIRHLRPYRYSRFAASYDAVLGMCSFLRTPRTFCGISDATRDCPLSERGWGVPVYAMDESQ
jgi:hypothetical protein